MGARERQLDGAQPSLFHDAPFYDVYRCADGECVTIGALEPPFYALLVERLGLTDVDPASQYDRARWPALKARFAEIFAQQPSAHWRALLEGTDACFAPLLSVADAAVHPHNTARAIYRTDENGNVRARVAPRFLPLTGTRRSRRTGMSRSLSQPRNAHYRKTSRVVGANYGAKFGVKRVQSISC